MVKRCENRNRIVLQTFCHQTLGWSHCLPRVTTSQSPHDYQGYKARAEILPGLQSPFLWHMESEKIILILGIFENSQRTWGFFKLENPWKSPHTWPSILERKRPWLLKISTDEFPPAGLSGGVQCSTGRLPDLRSYLGGGIREIRDRLLVT